MSTRNSGQDHGVDVNPGKTLWSSEPRQATNAAVAKAGNVVLLSLKTTASAGDLRQPTGFETIKRYKVADSETWTQPTIPASGFLRQDADPGRRPRAVHHPQRVRRAASQLARGGLPAGGVGRRARRHRRGARPPGSRKKRPPRCPLPILKAASGSSLRATFDNACGGSNRIESRVPVSTSIEQAASHGHQRDWNCLPATAAEPEKKRSWGNAYTWMLIFSLMFLTIGCLILLREFSFYNFQTRPV